MRGRGGAARAAEPRSAGLTAQPRAPRDTPARRAIADAIARLDHSFTARELYESLRETSPVGLVTVYRTLTLFTELGLVRAAGRRDTVGERGGPGRRGSEALYAACERVQHHHHLICERCGAVEESDVCRCDELGAELGQRHGFVLSPAVANYYGLCAACALAEA